MVRACSQKRALVVRRPMASPLSTEVADGSAGQKFFFSQRSAASVQRVFGAKAKLVAAICYGLQGSVGSMC